MKPIGKKPVQAVPGKVDALRKARAAALRAAKPVKAEDVHEVNDDPSAPGFGKK